jgi:UDP:flavonoid glycosyltransferase YjiC (YdhE family)
MRVLFTTTPGRGHFHPMVPLAKALQAGGHDVLWAAHENVCSRLAAEGFAARAAGLDEGATSHAFAQRYPEIESLPPAERPNFMFPRIFGRARSGPMLADLMPIAREWQPSLLVCDQAELAGPIVAAALGVPNLTHSFGSLLPVIRLERAAEDMAPLWEERGLDPRPHAGTYEHLYLDIYPSSLHAADQGHLPDVQPVRPVAFATGGDGKAPEWLDADSEDPLVYVTFGTVFNTNLTPLTIAVEAARELQVRVVVTVGPGRDVEALGPQPGNVHVAAYIPQTQVLPRCAAVISHAGSGTFLSGLGYGLPQVLLPQAADQFLNAAAGEQSGAALAIGPQDLDVERVREAAARALAEPSFAEAAGRRGDRRNARSRRGRAGHRATVRLGPRGRRLGHRLGPGCGFAAPAERGEARLQPEGRLLEDRIAQRRDRDGERHAHERRYDCRAVAHLARCPMQPLDEGWCRR